MLKSKAAPKPNRTGWIVFGSVALLVVYFVYSGGDDTPTTTKKPTTSKSKNSMGGTDFIPADYTIQFTDLKAAPKDSFLPLVSKASAGGSSDPGGLPTYLTNGESDWEYTGVVQVNGSDQALLENSKSLDSVYLSVGQHWKRGKVRRISDSNVQLEGDNGKLFTVKMSEGETKNDNVTVAPAADGSAPAAVQPPAMAGTIGQQLDVAPLPGVQMTGQPGNNGYGGIRRRGRRGGGGGGFGGG